MKLLLDQNLSARLLPSLDERFAGSSHVREFDLDRAEDERIWDFAAEKDFVIVSKDSDFYHRSLLDGHPPKVIWIDVGNCKTDLVRELHSAAADAIDEFGTEGERSIFILSRS